MPTRTPNEVGSAAAKYAAEFRKGTAGGAIDIGFLRQCALANPALRKELGVFFGILTPEGNVLAQFTLPQIRKNIQVYLITGAKPVRQGSRSHTLLDMDDVTFIGTKHGFWRIQYDSGIRKTITPGPLVLLTPEGKDLFTGKDVQLLA